MRYRNERIYRAATADEYKKELELRVGRQISKGLSKAQLNEFQLIDDQTEAVHWIERNVPDLRYIVQRAMREMERGVVLDAGRDDRLEP